VGTYHKIMVIAHILVRVIGIANISHCYGMVAKNVGLSPSSREVEGMILLTDEEISKLSMDAVFGDSNMVAKAQLKKVGKWGISPCRHKDGPLFKRECPYCWQDLLEEVMDANSIQPFSVTFKICPICKAMSELVDCTRRIYLCPEHGQWEEVKG